MKLGTSIIPLHLRRSIIDRKLEDLQRELSGVRDHMLALPGWDKRAKRLAKAVHQIEEWRKEL